jgi:hypothetical protein
MKWWERLLRRWFANKEIGWAEIGETFTRFTLLSTPFFKVLLHKLDAPRWHPQCHDHPWHFWTLILSGGYLEESKEGLRFRRPGTVLYRPARFAHNVITRGVGWSILVVSGKKREWGFQTCDNKNERSEQ